MKHQAITIALSAYLSMLAMKHVNNTFQDADKAFFYPFFLPILLWCSIIVVSQTVLLVSFYVSLSPPLPLKHNLAILNSFNCAGDVRGASLLCQTTHSFSHCNSSPLAVLPSSWRTVNQINELVHCPHRHTNTNPSLVLSFDFVTSCLWFCLKAFKFTAKSFLSHLCIDLWRKTARRPVS